MPRLREEELLPVTVRLDYGPDTPAPAAQIRTVLERLAALPDGLTFAGDRQRFKVILSLREDFLPQLEQLGERTPSLNRNRMRLVRMSGEQALEAATRPAPELVEEAVGRRVVEFVAGSKSGKKLERMEVEPALLSVVLRVLNERRIEAGQERITADLLTMSRERILLDFYEQAVGDLPPTVRIFIEERLLTRGGFRATVAHEDALAEGLTATSISSWFASGATCWGATNRIRGWDDSDRASESFWQCH